MSKKFIIIIYSIFFLFSLLFFLIIHFPLDAIVGHYIANVENMTRGQYRITHSKREINLIFDSRFHDFQILQRFKNGYKEIFFAPKLDIGFSLFSLISGNYNIDIYAEFKNKKFKDSYLDGQISLAGNRIGIDVSLNKVGLQKIGILSNSLLVPINGFVDGGLRLVTTNRFNIMATSAEFRFKIHDFVIPKTSYNSLGLKIPPVIQQNYLGGDSSPTLFLSDKNNPAYIEASMARGRINLKRFLLPGSSINLSASGRVRLITRGRRIDATASINGKLKISDEVRNKVIAIQTLDEERDPDGNYSITVKGDLTKASSYTIGKANLEQFIPKQ